LKVLVDTHAILWFALTSPKMSADAVEILENRAIEKMVSPVCYWEIALKIATKKYALGKPYEEFLVEAIEKNGFSYLHIELKHTAALLTMPFHHKDPFDRLLIAQAMVEGLPILSADAAFDAYPVKRLW
jgi:PIN domain nuclease of toxin-antitoxin system